MGARETIELPPTSFIGRAADLQALEALVPRSPLVTVLGPPGTGKTRLATRFAASYAESRRAVACFCDLTEATTAIGICAAVARALGGPLVASERQAPEQLGAAIARRGAVLLVLDNFEQVAEHAAATVGVWLRAAPEARFLVTSRQRLGLEGEALFDLGPLGLPRPGRPANESEAVQLFVERARSVRRDYELGEDDVAVVAELVQELDGLPLAIELCAARMRLLSPSQLMRDLPRRFQILSPGAVGGARGLEEALDSSWELLPPGERAALASLSVFRGGMSPAGAEAVMDVGDEAHPGRVWPLDMLQSLVDRSLVHTFEVPELAGERRFSLLVSIREFAANKLRASGREAHAVRRHADYFLSAFRAWRARAETGGVGEATRRLALEIENMLAVHRRALAAEGGLDAAEALEAAMASSQMITAAGPFGLGLSLLDAALGMPGAASCEPALRASALEARGSMLSLLGDPAGGAAACAEALEVAVAAADARVEARILATLASTLLSQGRWREARGHYERARAIHRRLHDRRSEGLTLIALAQTYFFDDLSASRARQEEALAIHRELGDRASEGMSLSRIASVHLRQGLADLARRLYEQALEIHAEVGDRRSEAATAGYLGILEQEQGRLAEARARYEQSLSVSRALGNRRVEGLFLGHLGNCDVEEDRLDDAIAHYEDALRVLAAAGSPGAEPLFRGCLGAALAARGHVDEGRAALDAAEQQLSRMPEQGSRALAVGIHRGHLDLALARIAAGASQGDEAASHRAAAERRAARGAAAGDDAEADIRFARRALVRALDGAREQRPAGLVVARTGRWFHAPEGGRVGLERRRSLRLVLEALAKRREASPGVATSLEEIVAVGWPGQRLHPEAAAERAYNAIATLRRFGLRDILQRRDDGYLLDPAVGFEYRDDDD